MKQIGSGEVRVATQDNLSSLVTLKANVQRTAVLVASEFPAEVAIAVARRAAVAAWPEIAKALKVAIERGVRLDAVEIEQLASAPVAAKLKEHLSTAHISQVAHAAETLARCGLMSTGTTRVVESAAADAAERLETVGACSTRPRLLAFAAVQLCSAGVANDRVYAAVAEQVVALAEATSLDKKSSDQGMWIRDATPPVISARWAAGTAALLASAGVRDPTVFQRLAAAAQGASAEQHLANLRQGELISDAELAMVHSRNLATLAEMANGTFSPASTAAMLVTHRADTSMHSHMTGAEGGAPELAASTSLQAASTRDGSGGPAAGSVPVGSPINAALALAVDFVDASLPLVIDVGCGRGSFLLALATHNEAAGRRFNYLGIERSAFLVGKAAGLAVRYGLHDRVRCVAAPATVALEWLEVHGYTANLICFNFPTPFAEDAGCPSLAADAARGTGAAMDDTHSGPRGALDRLADTAGHNTHLPSKAEFIVNQSVVRSARSLCRHGVGGSIFLQSDTEEVAVSMAAELAHADDSCAPWTACGADVLPGYGAIDRVHQEQLASVLDAARASLPGATPTRRSVRWRGAKATGPIWLPCNPWVALGVGARSESEAQCDADNIRVYRALVVCARH
jgi:tRNA G46 methylase TrmB